MLNFLSLKANFKGILMQTFVAFIGTLSTVSDGMQYGWSAPTAPLLLSNQTQFEVTKKQVEWLGTILPIGSCCGLPLTMLLVDKLGRRNSVLVASLTAIISWLCMAFTRSIELLFLARFSAGVCANLGIVSVSMYIAEIADKDIRGFLSCMVYLMGQIGILLVYSVVPFVPYCTTALIAVGGLTILVTIFPFLPPSPYNLLFYNRPEEAELSLKKLRQKEDVQEELQTISQAIIRQKNEAGRLKDLFLVPSNRKALLIMIFLNGSQHMSGLTVMLMNLHSILTSLETHFIDSSNAAIIFSSVMFATAAITSTLMDSFGRKKLFICSGLTTGSSLIIIAIYFSLKHAGFDVLAFSWVPVLAIILYSSAFISGIGLVPIVMSAELFPAKIKAFGMTFSDIVYVVFSVVSLQVFYLLNSFYGIHLPFFVFGVCCFLSTIIASVYLPETKGKTLEQIQMILKGSVEPKI